MTRLLSLSFLLVLLALPASAAAAKPSGVVTIDLAAGARSLRVGATAPAAASASGLTLPVRGGDPRVLRHGGTLRLGGVTLRSLRTTVVPRPALSALVRGRRVTLLHAPRGTAKIDGEHVTAAVRVFLTRTGARLLRRSAARAVGTLRIDATVPAAGPAPLARPSTAVDLTSAAMTWHVRDSFIQYMAAGEGTSASAGATSAAATVRPGSDAPLVYDFAFTFRDGWEDTRSGKVVARFRGTVRFSYKAHGITLRASDPEIELNGARSRAIFRVGSGTAPSRRAVLVDLDLAKAKAVGEAREIPGTIPASATSSVFAGYYLPGDPFGWMTLQLRS